MLTTGFQRGIMPDDIRGGARLGVVTHDRTSTRRFRGDVT
jgi:hypothetical protein